jgi:hypothetical protein
MGIRDAYSKAKESKKYVSKCFFFFKKNNEEKLSKLSELTKFVFQAFEMEKLVHLFKKAPAGRSK